MLAKARNRSLPFCAIAALDMAFDLGAEAEDEAALGKADEIPRECSGDHGTPRKRDCDRGAHLDSFGVLGNQRSGEKAVVAGFGNPERIEAGLLGGAGGSGYIAEITSRETGIELHCIFLPDRCDPCTQRSIQLRCRVGVDERADRNKAHGQLERGALTEEQSLGPEEAAQLLILG